MSADLTALKARLRAEARAARAAAHELAEAHLTPGGRAGQLSQVLAGYRGVPVAGYWPIHDEISPLPAMAEAAAHGPVGLPVIRGKALPLDFALWEPDAPMTRGAFGAAIPAEEVAMQPQIVILPLVGFDRAGGRLGYGGGFYDRTLERLRAAGPVLAVGFAYAAQELAEVPQEPTDQPLDMIVTESEVIELRR